MRSRSHIQVFICLRSAPDGAFARIGLQTLSREAKRLYCVGAEAGSTEMKDSKEIGRILVRKGGLEPPRFYPPDPKSGASANSATFARCFQRLVRSLFD